ncbi:putative cross-wall-targeting lipoprotein signal domain-containing proteiin [Streptomyces sp. NPDC059398]|uniref:putative cross-wall-targeting lipoprotein signal domain-containing proteiin n=1 Tax=Streptomyces sp. NPDC059398 TaxID=3346820 RepID=UPI0036B28B11
MGKRKIVTALCSVMLGAAALVPLSATTASADPTCGYLVTQSSTSNGAKVYTEAPKCGQQVQAVANCLKIGASAKVYGNIRTTAGYSTATCGSTAEVTQKGYRIKKSGSWGSIYWF